MSKALTELTNRISILRLALFLSVLFSLNVFLLAIPVIAESGAYTMAPRSGMLIPLYIYPALGAWDPLYTAIQTHPSVDFIIVINPSSGPGQDTKPDVNYCREIARLNSYPNVRTVGYVPVDYGRKALESAFADIAKYVGWGVADSQLAMQGIFVDESPQIADSHNTTYLEQIRQNIKNQKGLSGGLIVMNPGMVPDGQILSSADRTVVFEERFSTYVSMQAAKQLSALPDRGALACLIHSVPPNFDKAALKTLVNELKELAGSIFITDLADFYYSKFSPRFQEFVDVLV